MMKKKIIGLTILAVLTLLLTSTITIPTSNNQDKKVSQFILTHKPWETLAYCCPPPETPPEEIHDPNAYCESVCLDECGSIGACGSLVPSCNSTCTNGPCDPDHEGASSDCVLSGYGTCVCESPEEVSANEVCDTQCRNDYGCGAGECMSDAFPPSYCVDGCSSTPCTANDTSNGTAACEDAGYNYCMCTGDYDYANCSSEHIDQQQTERTNAYDTSNYLRVQSFTPSENGTLDRVDLELACGQALCEGGVNVSIGLNSSIVGENNPENWLYRATQALEVSTGGLPAWYSVNFTSPAKLKAGTAYVIGAFPLNLSGDPYTWSYSGQYANGQSYYYNTPSQQWEKTGAGEDFAFKTYMSCTSGVCVNDGDICPNCSCEEGCCNECDEGFLGNETCFSCTSCSGVNRCSNLANTTCEKECSGTSTTCDNQEVDSYWRPKDQFSCSSCVDCVYSQDTTVGTCDCEQTNTCPDEYCEDGDTCYYEVGCKEVGWTGSTCSLADSCGTETLTTSKDCGPEGCSSGTQHTCNAGSHTNCETQSCDGTTYYCSYDSTWEWRTSAELPEEANATCSDGIDNDCDGLIDDNDSYCGPPKWRSQGQNLSEVLQGWALELYAQGLDSRGLDEAWLSTNESGQWVNYSTAGDCYGTPNNCSSYSAENLSDLCSNAGCSWQTGVCSGSCTSCGSYSVEEECSEQTGCAWNGTGGGEATCDGTATTCGSIAVEGTCNSQFECSWMEACEGEAIPCDRLEEPELCEVQAGCSWSEGGGTPQCTDSYIDQEQNSSNSGIDLSTGGVIWAQSFKPKVSGSLDRVDIEASCNGKICSSDITVIISTTDAFGYPDTQITNETINPTTGGIPIWASVNFSNPASVTSGTTYAIVIAGGTSDSQVWRYDNTAPYSMGSALRYAEGRWGPLSADFTFKTYVDCPTAGESCSGTVTACGDIGSQSPCDNQLECRWTEECSGTTTPCGELGETDCGTQDGCTWDSGGTNPCNETHIDQEQSNSSVCFAFDNVSQVFRAGTTGTLNKVSIYLSNSEGYIQIRGVNSSAFPKIHNSTILANENFSLEGSGWANITLTSPPSLVSGNDYAIYLGKETGVVGICYQPDTNPYGNGIMWVYQGGQWIKGPDDDSLDDLPFRTYMNCNTSGDCSGSCTSCASMQNESYCDNQGGCSWTPGYCIGTPTDCDEISEENCLTYGCDLSSQTYGSPMNMNGSTDWTESRFTWRNASVTIGTIVGWRIWYWDIDGLVNGTSIMTFEIVPNTPPMIRRTRITPAPPTTTDNLRCSWIASDNESISLETNVTWYRNGEEWNTYSMSCTNATTCSTNSTTSPSSANTVKGDTWNCTVSTSDKELTAKASAVATINKDVTVVYTDGTSETWDWSELGIESWDSSGTLGLPNFTSKCDNPPMEGEERSLDHFTIPLTGTNKFIDRIVFSDTEDSTIYQVSAVTLEKVPGTSP